MFPNLLTILVFSFSGASPSSLSYPPFKFVKYTYGDLRGIADDPSLTLFQRIRGSSCDIYLQADTTDVFMFFDDAINKGWIISNKVSTDERTECKIKYLADEIIPWAYSLSWDVFPCREIEGISIVNDQEAFEDCSQQTIEKYKGEIVDYEYLFFSATEFGNQLVCYFQHSTEGKKLKIELNRYSSLFLLNFKNSNCSITFEGTEQRSTESSLNVILISIIISSLLVLLFLMFLIIYLVRKSKKKETRKVISNPPKEEDVSYDPYDNAEECYRIYSDDGGTYMSFSSGNEMRDHIENQQTEYNKLNN